MYKTEMRISYTGGDGEITDVSEREIERFQSEAEIVVTIATRLQRLNGVLQALYAPKRARVDRIHTTELLTIMEEEFEQLLDQANALKHGLEEAQTLKTPSPKPDKSGNRPTISLVPSA
ncbi:MAG: hypothetical protein AAB433_22680 [Nitrospirota bacterium]